MQPEDLVRAVARETDAYAAALEQAPDGALDRPVPACPGWMIRDLTHHLGEVHRRVVIRIRERRNNAVSVRPPADEDFVPWFREGAAALLAAVDDDPDRPAATFHPPATVGFWQRRQALENLVHLWDLESALGAPGPVDVALAEDGVAEVIEVFIDHQQRHGALGDLPYAVGLHATDTGRRWVLGPGDPVAEASAPAADLLLTLWKRRSIDDLSWSGDTGRGRRLLGLPLTP